MTSLHGYFLTALPRLWRASELFQLFKEPLGDVLEIGPFYGYMPFILRPQSSSYTVLEGDDPAVYPLIPIYKKSDIQVKFLDFFELFGPIVGATHALPLAGQQYDTILCWETMEHFNFNPVKFVRELLRILKPGGKAYITVPNKASLNLIAEHIFGRGEEGLIEAFYTFENYESNGKKAFYGFHWREYSSHEMAALFCRAGFQVGKAGTFVSFRNRGRLPFYWRAARQLYRLFGELFPRCGAYTYLIAQRPLTLPASAAGTD